MLVKYRSEIDGLRAIAVASVILYHAEFAFRGVYPFKGGFIGVDVFFVISGYLISSIILGGLRNGTFSFAQFYERRARRILPALFAVILASIPLAWANLLPNAMKEYAGSVLAALGFSSNIWFWLQDSYWAEPSQLKPFLHTWTLAVEEQFYVIFPIVLTLAWKFARKYILALFATAFFASLLLADFGSAQFPNAAFYLLPMRGWELLAGAILAKIELDRGRASHPILEAVMPALGVLFIAAAVAFFQDGMRHPSFITLLPVVGSMLIIWYCKPGEFITGVLSTRPFVAIGLISYSLYLWHFPIFAFARIREPALSIYDKVGLIALSVALAALTYFVIERPARKPNLLSLPKFGAAICAVLAVLLITNTVFVREGMPNRLGEFADMFSDATVPLAEAPPASDPCASGERCAVGGEKPKSKIFLVGDSHAAVLRQHLRQLAERHGLAFERRSMGSCPYIDVKNIRYGDCDAYLAKLKPIIAGLPPSIVVYAAHWRKYNANQIDTWNNESVDAAWSRTLRGFLDAGHTLVVVYPGFESERHLPQYVKQLIDAQPADERTEFVASMKLSVSYAREIARAADKRRMLDGLGEQANLIRVDPTDLFCSKETDQCTLNSEGTLFIADYTHYSQTAVKMIVDEIERKLVAAGAIDPAGG